VVILVEVEEDDYDEFTYIDMILNDTPYIIDTSIESTNPSTNPLTKQLVMTKKKKRIAMNMHDGEVGVLNPLPMKRMG